MGYKRKIGIGSTILFLLIASHILWGRANFEVKKKEIQQEQILIPHFWTQGYHEEIALITKLNLAQRLLRTQRDSAEQLALSVYRDSRRLHFYTGIVRSLYFMAMLQHKCGNFDSSTALYQTAVSLVKQIGMDEEHLIYIHIAHNFWAKANYEEALDYNYEAIDAMNAKGLKLCNADSASLFYNIAAIWHKLGESSRAMEKLALLKKIVFHSGDLSARLKYYSALPILCPHITERQKLLYYNEIVRLSRTCNNKDFLGGALNGLCTHYIEKGLIDSATRYLNCALTELAENPTKRKTDYLLTYINKGRILELKHHDEAAEKVFKKVYGLADSLQFWDVIMFLDQHLAAFYNRIEKNNKAYAHITHYTYLQNTILSQQKTRSVDNWIKARMAEKNKQLLKKQLLISQQIRQLQNKNFWIIAIALCCLLLCSLLLTFLHSYRNRQKTQRGAMAQLHQEQQINQLKAQVRGEEQERNRIATDLHDGIASQLWAMKLNLDDVLNNVQGYPQQRLKAIYSHLDLVAQEIRETAHNLMPGLLLEEGLSRALGTLCKRLEKSGQLEVEFQEYGALPDLDWDIQLSLYRMIQELIQNALKHANATLLLVQLSYVDTLLNITVEDNGKGMATTSIIGGMGLRKIQHRVATLQGQFDLKSKKGVGTNVYMEFDIRCFPLTPMVAHRYKD